jgi:hypothetical protein
MLIRIAELAGGLAGLALQLIALWAIIEGAHWIYCKVRGVKY